MTAGRFNTIFASFLILLVGICLLPVVAVDYFKMFGYDSKEQTFLLSVNWKRFYFLISIVLCGVGFGGIKANISPLGAQQVEWFGEQAVHSFFNWFFWFANVGGCIAYLAVVYIQQEVGFDVGYLIPAATLLLALIIFLIPRNYYREHPTGENGLVDRFMSILWSGTSSCIPRPPANCSTLDTPDSVDYSMSSSVAAPRCFLDAARLSCGGEYDDEEVDVVRDVIMTVPVFLTLIVFSAFTSQTTSTMLLQGERMDARIGGGDSSQRMFPVASLNFVKMAVITALIPVLDRCIFPLLDSCNRKPTLLQRIGFGMLIGVVSLVLMGVVETVRKADMRVHGALEQEVAGVRYNASRVSLAWQTPQFLLAGVAEAFTLVAALEFAYTECPFALQGLVMGMNHVTTGLGALLGSAFYNAVALISAATGEAWLPNEINEGRLEWFLFLLAGVLLANLCLFVLIARRYTYNCLGAAIALPNSSSSYTNDLSTSHGASRPSLSSSGPLLLVPEPI